MLKYCPEINNNKSPYEEILNFKKPTSVLVFRHLELNCLKEDLDEWNGKIKLFKYSGKTWYQWTWKNIRVHFIKDNQNKEIIIINAFKKDQNKTLKKFKNRSYDNYVYWESIQKNNGVIV